MELVGLVPRKPQQHATLGAEVASVALPSRPFLDLSELRRQVLHGEGESTYKLAEPQCPLFVELLLVGADVHLVVGLRSGRAGVLAPVADPAEGGARTYPCRQSLLEDLCQPEALLCDVGVLGSARVAGQHQLHLEPD